MNYFEIQLEKALRCNDHQNFKKRVREESLRVWASIATKKQKEDFKKMFTKHAKI